MAGGLNLYGYANGDPVNFSDPFGLCPIPPSNCFQEAANWGAQRGGAVGWVALNGGAAGAGLFEAFGGGDVERAGTALGEGRYLAAAGSAALVLPAGRALRAGATLRRLGAKLDNLLPAVDRTHLSAAAAELGGAATGYDHVTEVRSAMNGLWNTIQSLNGVLGNPHITAAEREVAEGLLSRASRALDAAEQVFR